jgi:NADH dehydrogenase
MIFLTGGTGFIGRHVLRRLRERGMRVRCLVLPEESLGNGGAAGVVVVRGDITQSDRWAAGADAIDTVIHCAAAMLPNRADHIRRVNVEGTRNVVRFAQEVGVRRFIYFSAVSAAYRQMNVYGRSKAEAESLVSQSGLDYTILRPTMVYGRDGGLHFQQLVRLVQRAPGALPVLGSGRARLQPVAIDDVAQALDLVLNEPRCVGKIYGVAGATALTFDEYVDLLSAVLGRRRPLKLHVPLAVCAPLARLLESVIGPNFFSPEALRGINEDATLDYRPLQTDCGYAPMSLEVGLRAALRPT